MWGNERVSKRGPTRTSLYHFRFPREHEKKNEDQETSADEDLDESQNKHEPIEKRFSPEPVGNHTSDRDWFEDGQQQVNDVGIVELVMIRQPPAFSEIPIDGHSCDHVNERKQCGFHVMAGPARTFGEYICFNQKQKV